MSVVQTTTDPVVKTMTAVSEIELLESTSPKVVALRDERGRLLPGQTPNPAGRPKGSRNKLAEDFTAALYQDFQAHGLAAIQATRDKDPATYVRVIASLLPKEVEIKRPLEGLSEDQLHEAIATLQAMMHGVTIDGEASKVVDNSQDVPPL